MDLHRRRGGRGSPKSLRRGRLGHRSGSDVARGVSGGVNITMGGGLPPRRDSVLALVLLQERVRLVSGVKSLPV